MAGDHTYVSRSEPRQRRSRDESPTMMRKRRRSVSPPPTTQLSHSRRRSLGYDDDDQRYNLSHKRSRRSRHTYYNSTPRHRSPRSIPDLDPPSDPNMYEAEEYRQANINMKKLQFFEEHSAYDWMRDIYDPSRETCIQQSKEMLEAAVSDYLNWNYVETVPSEKYGTKYNCKAKGCAKGFKARNFAEKHLKGKHPELVRELTEKASDAVYFHSYMRDRNAPYPEQKSDLPGPPAVVMPIAGAGPLGPFLGASFEKTLEVMGQSNLKSPLILPHRHGRPRQGGCRYVDLDAPEEGNIFRDYRTL